MSISNYFETFLQFVSQPWHWSVGGVLLALIVFFMTWMGQSFGVSTSFKALCSVAGAGKRVPFFNINIKQEYWRLAFVLGALIGGLIAATYLKSPEAVDISASTIAYLQSIGIDYSQADTIGSGLVFTELFNYASFKGVFLALAGGFLVGFGARYGNGCTSGHAITGMAHLQLPSFLTVIGFFIGGIFMTYLIFPHLMNL